MGTPTELVRPVLTEAETIPVRDGLIEVDRYGVVVLRPLHPNVAVVLCKFDIIELARKAFGSDAHVLEGLATNMRLGHRWTTEDHYDPRTGDLEPF